MRYGMLVLALSGLLLGACEPLTTPILASSAPAGGSQGTGNGAPLAVLPAQVQLVVGATAQLTTNASTALLPQVEWRSLHPAVAAVSPAGLVTALSAGTATIQARFAFDTTQAAIATVTVIGPASAGTSGSTGNAGGSAGGTGG